MSDCNIIYSYGSSLINSIGAKVSVHKLEEFFMQPDVNPFSSEHSYEPVKGEESEFLLDVVSFQ